jgi:hypothetical protein
MVTQPDEHVTNGMNITEVSRNLSKQIPFIKLTYCPYENPS